MDDYLYYLVCSLVDDGGKRVSDEGIEERKAMSTEETGHSSPLHRVVTRLVNERGETYFCKVQTMFPAALVRGLWVSIDEYANVHDDNYFMGELTDRIRDFRTTVSRSFERGWEVCIRTHAWSPVGDKRELHVDVLRYLREQGLSV